MRILWKVSREDVRHVRAFYGRHAEGVFVRNRRQALQMRSGKRVTIQEFWRAMVASLVTTQQRSGPNSPVGRFIAMRPFPLRYRVCADQKNLAKFVGSVLTAHGGVRRARTIGQECSANYTQLQEGLWAEMRPALEALRSGKSAAMEREVADFINDHFSGFGPKQSRNWLQTLALTRYEIPIDSRITRWLNEFGFPMKLSAMALADRDYYHFVLDGFQQLCAACDILPCLMDAAIFSSYDGDAWTEKNIYRW